MSILAINFNGRAKIGMYVTMEMIMIIHDTLAGLLASSVGKRKAAIAKRACDKSVFLLNCTAASNWNLRGRKEGARRKASCRLSSDDRTSS